MTYSDNRCPGLSGGGFSLVELIIIVVILMIAAMIAVPVITSAESFQIRSTANMIAADLEYAKQMAIGRGGFYSVVFDETNESYQIINQSGDVVAHPVKIGQSYSVDLTSDSRTNSVDIVDVDFDSTSTVKFDCLGSPYNGSGTSLAVGKITLRAGDDEMTVSVEPVTGHISIQ
ncbi:MAG: hypothetical protein GWO86_01190 [Planctomycetes bacterium]|nr:hypothetical protein [Planctomycetota bacterium]